MRRPCGGSLILRFVLTQLKSKYFHCLRSTVTALAVRTCYPNRNTFTLQLTEKNWHGKTTTKLHSWDHTSEWKKPPKLPCLQHDDATCSHVDVNSNSMTGHAGNRECTQPTIRSMFQASTINASLRCMQQITLSPPNGTSPPEL